jgi:hypothetical protein
MFAHQIIAGAVVVAQIAATFTVYPSLSGSVTKAARRLRITAS